MVQIWEQAIKNLNPEAFGQLLKSAYRIDRPEAATSVEQQGGISSANPTSTNVMSSHGSVPKSLASYLIFLLTMSDLFGTSFSNELRPQDDSTLHALRCAISSVCDAFALGIQGYEEHCLM